MVKKLIQVKGITHSPYSMGNTICFAFMSNPDGEEGRKQATGFLTCRDHINDTLRAVVHGHTNYNLFSSNVDMSKLRLLIGRNCGNRKAKAEFKEKIFSAKRLLNFYENVAGWDKPSKITTVRMKGGSIKHVWLVTGPVEWLGYSQLTSMVTLIFRSIGKYGPIEFHDINSAEKWFENLLAKYEEEKHSGMYKYDPDLHDYLRVSYPKFYMIMKYHKEIFTQPLEEAYPAEGSIHGPGGIYQLCSFNTGNSVLDANMVRTWKKYKDERRERINRRTEAQYETARGAPSL